MTTICDKTIKKRDLMQKTTRRQETTKNRNLLRKREESMFLSHRTAVRIRVGMLKQGSPGLPPGFLVYLHLRLASPLHADDFVTAIHVEHLAGHGGCTIAGEVGGRGPQFLQRAGALQRRLLFVYLEHARETGYAARGQGLHRTGGYAVHADGGLAAAQVIGQVFAAGLQRGLGNSHQVVVRHHLLAGVVRQRGDGAAIHHERSHGSGKGDERVGRDLQGEVPGIARNIGEVAIQGAGGLRGKSHGMQQHVHMVGVLSHEAEEVGYRLVIRHVQGAYGGVLAEMLAHQLDDAVLQALALVVEDESGAGCMPGLGNAECDAAVVCHAGHDADLAC